MAKGYFITGTDTECGKTEITLGLMHKLQNQGLKVLGMKPVASGAVPAPDGLRNEDALRIQQQASAIVDYDLVNPYAFEPAIAPHLAAAEAGVDIDFAVIERQFRTLSGRSDRVIVEGVGGWRVPLGEKGDVSTLARSLELPVILVVGLKLGCINHALLTTESIRQSGLALAGWIGNRIDAAMLSADENIDTLRRRIEAPCLGIVPWMNEPSPARVAGCIEPPV